MLFLKNLIIIYKNDIKSKIFNLTLKNILNHIKISIQFKKMTSL